MIALASVGEYKALTGLSVSGSAEEYQVTAALLAATAAAERYCGREFTAQTVTEYYDGTGYPDLCLNRWPVSDAQGDAPVVYLDVQGKYGQAANSFPSNTLLTQGTNYVVRYEAGFLQATYMPGWWPPLGGPSLNPWGYANLTRHGGAAPGWPKVPGCVKVTYKGGYGPGKVPYDLRSAVVAMAAYILVATPGGGMVTTSQSYIDTSVGSGFLSEMLARGNVPALGSARSVLDSYREQRIARGIW